MAKFYSINGDIMPSDEAVLKVTDISILRGYGLFDFFLVKNGHPLFIDDYVERFEQSARLLHLEIQFSKTELIQHIYQLIEANGEQDASIRLVLTGGYSTDGYAPASPNLLMLQHKGFPYPEAQYQIGGKLIIFEHQRSFPTIKATNYLVGIKLLPETIAAGAEDVLFHWNGFFSETTRANFYIVKKDGTIVTAADGILKGVTRKQTLSAAAKFFKVEERSIALHELETAAEAFITNTTKRVMPIIKVGDVTIGNGKPGETALKLLRLFKEKEMAYLKSKAGVSV